MTKEFNLIVNDTVVVYYATFDYCMEVLRTLKPIDREHAKIITDRNYKKFLSWGIL